MKGFFLFCLIPFTLFANGRKEFSTTTITSDRASYDGFTVELNGSVCIENNMGVVTAGMATLKKGLSEKTAIEFPYLELNNHVQATLTNDSTLVCDTLYIDCIALTSHFEADKGLIYRDKRGQIIANEADLFYAKNKKQYEPIKVMLFGNVKLKSVQETFFSCALASRVEIFPQENKMLLFGSPVLFYDSAQKMQLSAYKIEAKRDEKTGKESVQGFGQVSFVFAEEEFEKLKQQFDIGT